MISRHRPYLVTALGVINAYLIFVMLVEIIPRTDPGAGRLG